MHPWEQQSGESPEAYRAFRMYLDLGASRSLAGAYQVHARCRAGAGTPVGKRAPGTWQGWAKKYRWNERAMAYDVRGQQVAHQATETVIATIASDRAARMMAQEQQEYKIAGLIGAKILEMLEVGLVKRKVAKDDAGNITVFEPAKWTFGTIAQLAEVFAKLGRVSLNMPVKVDPSAGDEAPYFETSGQMEDCVEPGQVPPMPADAGDRPPMGDASTGRGATLQQPGKPPRPER